MPHSSWSDQESAEHAVNTVKRTAGNPCLRYTQAPIIHSLYLHVKIDCTKIQPTAISLFLTFFLPFNPVSPLTFRSCSFILYISVSILFFDPFLSCFPHSNFTSFTI